MTVPSSASIIRVPGRLIASPTSLSIAEPYGGTYLGTCRDQEFTPEPILRPVWNQVWGTWSTVIYGGERPIFRAVVRYPDVDMLLMSMFSPVTTGSSGAGFRFSAGAAGRALTSTSFKLLFAARAPNAHPSFIMYAATPALDEAAKLQFSFGEEFGLAVAFYGVPDTLGRVYQLGRLNTLGL